MIWQRRIWYGGGHAGRQETINTRCFCRRSDFDNELILIIETNVVYVEAGVGEEGVDNASVKVPDADKHKTGSKRQHILRPDIFHELLPEGAGLKVLGTLCYVCMTPQCLK